MAARRMTAEDVEKHNARVREFRYGGGALGGKTAAMEAAMAAFTQKNPGATVARFRHGECIVEKSAGSGSIADVDAELRSLGVPMHLLPKPKAPRMNKLEAEWAMVLEARKRAGEILWYGFEAIKLRLADNTHYTPDFAIIDREGKLVFHETKGGFWRDDARVKIKVAAEMFPFFKFYALKKKRKKDGGGWDIEGF